MMRIKEAVAARIPELCAERHIAVNTPANTSGVSPSTVYSILNAKSQNPGVVSLQKLCDGWGISMREFFNSPLFDDIQQEIQTKSALRGAFCLYFTCNLRKKAV